LNTGFAIAALAIGIGANTGMFRVVNALLLRSLPFRDSERLVLPRNDPKLHMTQMQFHQMAQPNRAPRGCRDLRSRRSELAVRTKPSECI
jgi:hypothetical protein